MVNVHSHAFQRDMRGAAERISASSATDDFWSWRKAMFDTVAELDPDAMHRVALAVYREMADAGYGTVGEFHYVHHQPDGTPYAEPNAMAFAVAEAAQEAGLEIVLLPAAYHRNGWRDGADVPPESGQRRFCDPDVESFLARVDALRAWASARRRRERGGRGPLGSRGAGVVAVRDRAVRRRERPRAARARAGAAAGARAVPGRARLLSARTARAATVSSGPRTTVVHAIHVSDRDVELLAATRSIVAACPTTEANLGDGFLPALRYRDAGVRLTIGSDSNVRIDPFEEVRELETLARREGVSRNALLARTGDLWGELRRNGAASLDAGAERRLQIDMDHPSIRGVTESDLPYALATCAEPGVIARNSIQPT